MPESEFTFAVSATFKVRAHTESKAYAALTKALRDGSGFNASRDRIDMFFDSEDIQGAECTCVDDQSEEYSQ